MNSELDRLRIYLQKLEIMRTNPAKKHGENLASYNDFLDKEIKITTKRIGDLTLVGIGKK